MPGALAPPVPWVFRLCCVVVAGCGCRCQAGAAMGAVPRVSPGALLCGVLASGCRLMIMVMKTHPIGERSISQEGTNYTLGLSPICPCSLYKCIVVAPTNVWQSLLFTARRQHQEGRGACAVSQFYAAECHARQEDKRLLEALMLLIG